MSTLTKYWCVLMLIAFSSCKENQSTKNQVSYVKNITTSTLVGDSIPMNNIYEAHKLIALDTLLIITSFNGDYFFHIYNINTFKLIKEFGKKGRGPDEFLAPRITMQRLDNNLDGSDLLIFDEGRKTISSINILYILLNKEDGIKTRELPKQMVSISDIIFMNDSIAFYAPSGNENLGRFSIYHFSTTERTFIPYLPDLGFKVHANNLYPIYATSSACVNESKKRFVAIPVLLGELDFFDFSGNYIKSTIIERVNEIKNAKYEKMIFQTPGVGYYITDLQSVNDKIYALFTTKKFPNLKNKSISEIYVFDWDGNPIEKYVLDREINSFAYDSSNNRFIGYSTNNNEYPLFKYDLN
jgi:hypothetical protein